MNVTIKTTAIASLLTGTLLFASCTAVPAETAPVSGADTEVVDIVDAETAADRLADSVEAGETVTVEMAEQLADAKGETRTYELSDGTHVVTKLNEPLPKVVVEEITAEAAQNPGPSSSANPTPAEQAQWTAANNKRAKTMDQARASTGKEIVLVQLIATGLPNGVNADAWCVLSTSGQYLARESIVSTVSAEDAAAQAEAWIQTLDNPAKWEVVIVR